MCGFTQAQYKLSEDSPAVTKHVGANVGYFHVNLKFFVFDKESICL